LRIRQNNSGIINFKKLEDKHGANNFISVILDRDKQVHEEYSNNFTKII